MDCRILRELTVKSDGHICCDDSNGYDINLGFISEKRGWSLRKVIEGPIYNHVRTSFNNGVAPWGETCKGCDLYHSGGNPVDTLNKKISLRIEPTLACDLACAFCKRRREVSVRTGDWHLSLEKFKALINNCISLKIEIDLISYLGWGEPLNHPNFKQLVSIARTLAPKTHQEVTTVANSKFEESVGNSEIDTIIISCDGITQEKYQKYRVNGNLSMVFDFIKESRLHKNINTKIIWKYILFEHNDDNSDINFVQNFADENEVDEVHFILTNTKNKSKKYTIENIADFPLISKRARVVPAAALQRIVKSHIETIPNLEIRSGKLTGYIDVLHRTNSDLIICQGWAITSSGQPIHSLKASVDGRNYLNAVSISEARPDVREHVTGAQGLNFGFTVHVPLGAQMINKLNLVFQLDLEGEVVAIEIEF